MSWHFSQALVEAYSAANCSDGKPSAQSSGSLTPLAYLCSDRMTAFSRLSRFGMTFKPLTADHGEAVLTWFLAGFPAKTSAQPERAQESTEHAAECGSIWPESFARWDRATSSWKTPQCSLLAGLDEFSETWPRWGMMRGGECSELSIPEHLTSGNGSGLLPTPIKDDAHHRTNPAQLKRSTIKLSVIAAHALWPTPNARDYKGAPGAGCIARGGRQSSLPAAVKQWPTPQASDNRNRGNADTPAIARRIAAGKQVMLTMTVSGGQLNPTWVEWLMGWPLGWTDSLPSATDKFQQWLSSHGKSSGQHQNTLADSVADGAQGEPATARCVELLVAHETKAESANSAFEEGAK
jgi:hypothetical protein